MLSGLSSLLFGSGGTDAAAVDQTQASLPTTLTTKDDDMGWVLVDTAEVIQPDSLNPQPSSSLTEAQERLELANIQQVHPVQQSENLASSHAVQQRHRYATRLHQAVDTIAEQQKQFLVQQRQQTVTVNKKLAKKHLERGNKTCFVQSASRKQSSSHRCALRPCGSMKSRHSQRKH